MSGEHDRFTTRDFIRGVLGKDDRQISRREFGRVSSETVLGAGLALATVGVLAKLSLDKENGPKRMDGQPVEGTEGDYETQNLAGGPFPVYKDRDESRQLGISFPDQRVKARAFLGVTYPSNSIYASHEENDGQEYGWWYQVDMLPIYERADNGEYAFKEVFHGAWVKVDFLTRVREASDNLADAQ